MKQRVLLSVNILIVLALVVASALLANRWRLEGSNYSAKRKADGVIERNTTVANANRDAEIILTRYTSEGEKERLVKLAAAEAESRVRQARADTVRVKLNNESTAAQADVVRALSNPPRRGFQPSSDAETVSSPLPNPFENVGQPTRGFKSSGGPNPFENVGQPPRGFKKSK